jgi:hypothetical protein
MIHTDRLTDWSIGILFVGILLLGGCGSDQSGGHSHSHGSHSHDGSGEPRVIEGAGPELRIEVEEDPAGGYRVSLRTRRFVIKNAAESMETSGDTVAGHAHLYVDRKMVAMFYESSRRLPVLEPGRHVISVMLSDSGHRPFVVDGSLVRDTAVIQVPGDTDAE